MLVYLDLASEKRYLCERLGSTEELHSAIIEGASQRIRPIMMTAVAITGGLVPIMWATTTGSQVMKRIAAPMVGGMVTATILTLVVIPAVYALWKGYGLKVRPPEQLKDARGATASDKEDEQE